MKYLFYGCCAQKEDLKRIKRLKLTKFQDLVKNQVETENI